MAVDKAQTPFVLPQDEIEDDGADVELPDEDIEIGILNPDAISIETEDGGVIVDFSGGKADPEIGHDANLAEHIDEKELAILAADLVQDFEADRRSRKDWAMAYVKGLDLLGFKVEDRSQPWPGAAGVFHPLLAEAVVRFQAQAMGELFPASGPARPKVLGEADTEKMEQAQRVTDELNYQMTEEMTECRDEMEQMLFYLPLAGSTFKKVYYDPIRERPVSMFVPAEDFVVSYGASDLATCDRYTHVMKKSPNEIKRLQLNGFYVDEELPAPAPDISDIQEKYDELDGESATIDDDDRHTLLEMHVDIDLPGQFADDDGIARPYIVTIDKSSKTVLSIRRNWVEGDEKQQKRMHFVHYRYLPGLGFYGTGQIHLIGGLAKSATSIMRQLIDAGTLSNLPGGLKARGLRIKGDNSPIMPGEFRDVDVPGGAIRDAITFLPNKEPSAVLYNLLGNVVDEGRRISSVADVEIGKMSPEAPVGTTLALLERSLKVMSGVQARLHAALGIELKLIAKVIHDFMPKEYAYDDEGEYDRVKDFDGRVDVVPVSDPNAATMAQRVVQYQTALQLAQQAPQLYDQGKLHRQMLEVLGIPDADDIVKLPDDIPPKDPVTENMAMLKQEPVKVFAYQDHEAHIQVHMAAMQDPKIQQMVGQSPFAAAIQNASMSHITEHVAMQYRVEIQKRLGVEMPDPEAELPEDIEREVSRMAAIAADKLLKSNQAEQAQMEAQAQEEDPLTQIQRAELELKQREMDLKEAQAKHQAALDLEKLRMDDKFKQAGVDVQRERIDSDEERTAVQVASRLATDLDREQRADRRKGAELGLRAAEQALNKGNGGAPAKDDGGNNNG